MNELTPIPTDRHRAYRARKKAAGLREIRRWVPDIRSPEFLAEAKRQAALADQGDDVQEAAELMERLARESWEDWR